jgi:hypothetical protein
LKHKINSVEKLDREKYNMTVNGGNKKSWNWWSEETIIAKEDAPIHDDVKSFFQTEKKWEDKLYSLWNYANAWFKGRQLMAI